MSTFGRRGASRKLAGVEDEEVRLEAKAKKAVSGDTDSVVVAASYEASVESDGARTVVEERAVVVTASSGDDGAEDASADDEGGKKD